MVNPGKRIVEAERRERVHGPASLGLVPEDIPAGRAHGEAPLLRGRRRGDSGVGPKEGSAQKGGVGAGVVLPAVRRGASGRGDVEESEVGSGSAGDEPVGVDGPRRRLVVVGVDHAVDVARWGQGFQVQ